ncbi:MAG TPA: ATP-binding protein [Gemmatimonadaceae bacterium]|nr:ATP-binding protein [Gemmatimonadaceae bacterium]
MPLAHSRRIRSALWIATAALVVPVVITLLELPGGGVRPWLRLGALAIIAGTLALLIGRQRAFESTARAMEKFDAELRASEAKFSGILAIAADAIITTDQTQKIIHFNKGAEEIFGYPASETIGRHLAMLLPPRYRHVHDAHMSHFAQSDDTARRMAERREIFGLRADGTEFPAEASISKLVAPDGVLFTVVLRDITEHKRAEEDERFLSAAGAALGRSLNFEQTLQAIVDTPVPRLADACLLDIVTSTDRLQRIPSERQREDLTPALRALSDVVLSWDSPSPVVDVIRRQRAEHVAAMGDDWLEANEEAAAFAHWRELGAKALYILPLTAGDHTLGALTLISTDEKRQFTPDRRALAQKYASLAAASLDNARLYRLAQRANRARDEVLSVVSHDLRNPISAIAMCARVLRETPPAENGKREELLVTISESTQWVNRLIQDLLDVANIERGQLSLQIAPQDPTQLALQAMHMFDVEAAQHGITLDTQVDTNLPLVSGDPARIVQVLGNLLRNAIKFTPRGGHITLGVAHRDTEVEFFVRDTGSGIPLSNQRKIFERYWQSADGARETGSGLGLSIAKGIIEAHGGRIWVESVPGVGSTFAFTVPNASPVSVE